MRYMVDISAGWLPDALDGWQQRSTHYLGLVLALGESALGMVGLSPSGACCACAAPAGAGAKMLHQQRTLASAHLPAASIVDEYFNLMLIHHHFPYSPKQLTQTPLL